MNSFRPLVYLSGGANATRVFCRDSGLVQGDFAPVMHWAYAELIRSHSVLQSRGLFNTSRTFSASAAAVKGFER